MKTGIYGGSFSPPHSGHMRLAECFLDSLELDRLIVMPAGNPPHKQIDGGADGMARLEMCRAAFLPLSPKIEVSDYEALRTDPCYTVDTLRHFSDEGKLYMLCGSDMFLTLEKWREPQDIFRLATVVCGTRVGDAETVAALEAAAERYRSEYGARTIIMDFDPVEVSSTELREKLKNGEYPDELCGGVVDIIRSQGLYGFNG